MILGLTTVQFILMMSVILVLLLVPIVSWIVRRKLQANRSKTGSVPPLMYITAVSTARTSDVDIPYLPSPGEANFLPPSYEDICNDLGNKNQLSVSSMSLNIDDELPEYSAVGSQRSSIVFSTFYSNTNSTRTPETAQTGSDAANDSDAEETPGRNYQAFDIEQGNMGVFVA